VTGTAILALAGVILSPLPLMFTGHGSVARRMRGLLHTLAMTAFCGAAWHLSGSAGRGAGLILLLSGALWSGVFWIASIRRRLVSHAHPARIEYDADAGPVSAHRSANGEENGDTDALRTEQEFLSRMMELKYTNVGRIAVPRESIIAADCGQGIEAALRMLQVSGFLRIPMTDGNLDRIVGILHAKDVVPIALERRPLPSLKSIMRRPLFVSRDRSVAGLLELFRAQRGHMAVVVDDLSRTVGIATRDDIFRFLSGGGEQDP
jgi:CBS domain containing-hemolysin-like protein